MFLIDSLPCPHVCSPAHSYVIDEGIAFLTMTVKPYPNRLAFLFLDEIRDGFLQDLQKEFGEKYAPAPCAQYHFNKYSLARLRAAGGQRSTASAGRTRSSNSVRDLSVQVTAVLCSYVISCSSSQISSFRSSGGPSRKPTRELYVAWSP